MKYLRFLPLSLFLSLSIGGVSAEEVTKPATDLRTEGPRDRNILRNPESYTLSHDTAAAMHFLVGHWTGKSKAGEHEECWTIAADQSIIGWRKLTNSGKVEFQLIHLQTGRHGCEGVIRTFSNNFDDRGNIAKVLISKATYGKNPSVELSSDGMNVLSYSSKNVDAVSLQSNSTDEVQLKKL
ncbi:MAG: hypothetical protein HC888_07070 [Candidatus Competibacteraceae bacterium]|nr:hypothetical protein [Candidatus Competibacteraceae bacterium]